MIIEPRALLGVGVRDILDREPDIEIVAQVRSPDEALPFVDEAAPDVILVDAPLPERSAAEATRRLLQEAPESALVVLGREDDDASILGAIEVGAAAHVAELAGPAQLLATIRDVADGGDPLKDELIGRPDLIERLVDGVRDAIAAGRGPLNPLTRREVEVLRLVAGGLRNREIARKLGISEQTAKNHLSTVLHKLGVPNRTHAVTFAVQHGWIDFGDVALEEARQTD